MPRTKYCDKVLDRHKDYKTRRKIVRAKLREMVDGKITPYQKMLLDTLVPLYLEIHEMSNRYGEPGFDVRLYAQLQNSMRVAIDRYTSDTWHRRPVDRPSDPTEPQRPQRPQNGPCDLGALFG